MSDLFKSSREPCRVGGVEMLSTTRPGEVTHAVLVRLIAECNRKQGYPICSQRIGRRFGTRAVVVNAVGQQHRHLNRIFAIDATVVQRRVAFEQSVADSRSAGFEYQRGEVQSVDDVAVVKREHLIGGRVGRVRR